MRVCAFDVNENLIKNCNLKFKNESDKQLHENFVDYLHDGLDGLDYNSLLKALKTIEILKENYPYSKYILECYRAIKFANMMYDSGKYKLGAWVM